MHERQHLRLLLALVLAATLAGGTFSIVSAANPAGWRATAAATPTQISADDAAGYTVTFTNDGPSNISQLYLMAATPSGATFIEVAKAPVGVVCNTGGPLFCNIGAVNAGSPTLEFVVVYDAPSSGPLTVDFQFSTTGVPSGKNRSHGDALTVSATTQQTTSGNFAGRFAYTNTLLTVADNQTIGRTNRQATTATGPETDIPITVGEVPLSTYPCPPVAEGECFSEWSEFNVGAGKHYDLGFTAQVALSHFEVPGNITADTVRFLHVLDNGSVDELERCTTAGQVDCFTAVQQGLDILTTFILTVNGRVGGY
jgi:uncharacterized repeat protein (TIGR01451 family)